MSPQPTASQQSAPAEKVVEKTLTEELFEELSKIPEAERDIPEVQFLRAVTLEGRKAALQREINANRQFLRIMKDTDTLSDDLAEWLEVFYPTKEKDAQRSKDEVTDTRQNHEAAASVAAKASKGK